MTRLLALSLAAAAAIAAPAIADTSLAGDISVAPATTQTSTTTRADVRSQIGRVGETEWMRQRANPFEDNGYTRAEARGEYLKFRAETSPMTGEDSGSVYLQQRAAAASSARAMGAGPR
jgi:hypothetical protein